MLTSATAFSGFAVKDLDEARAFYGDTLELKTSEDHGLLMLDLGGPAPTVVYPKPDHEPANFTILNFAVGDVEAAVDGLAERGITFDRYDGFDQDERGIARDAGGPPIAWFRDPSGNILSVMEAS